MKYKDYLRLLNFKEKIVFTYGLMVERFNLKNQDYRDLKSMRLFLFRIMGLGYRIDLSDSQLILSNGDKKIFLRKQSSDFNVFEQVFLDNEYAAVINCIKSNGIQVDTIIDAGANIGLSSLQFIEQFPGSKILCLEPDLKNFQSLSLNLTDYHNKILLNEALWGSDEAVSLVDDFRDGKDWSLRVSKAKELPELMVNGISLNSLIRKFKIDSIDLLKMDIEGSETELFKEGNDCSFLKIVKILAIEIHDELDCRQRIYDTLRSYSFVLFNSGEVTVGINYDLITIKREL